MRVVDFRLVIEQDDGTQISIEPAGKVELLPFETVEEPQTFPESPFRPMFSRSVKAQIAPVKFLPDEKTGITHTLKVVKGP